jgi:hypothetical protein
MATLNDGELCRETLRHWQESGWVRVAPHSPLTALQGPEFHDDLTVSEFCGRGAGEQLESLERTEKGSETAPPEEDGEQDEHA